MSLFAHASPDELKVFIVDPKAVDFAIYKGLPYCPIDPINEDMSEAYGLMIYLTILMDQRYQIIKSAGAGVKNIDGYNEWVENNPEEARIKGMSKLPYILVLVDEYNDLVMQHREVETPIVRLGQKSRAAGIHCIIATQRPSADVITSTLKANIPSRIGLMTTDYMNSRVILDEEGCEKLLGKGDSLVKADNQLTRVQGMYITDSEMIKIFDYLKENYTNNPVPKEDYSQYKQVLIDSEQFEWVEDYDDSVPLEKRKIKPVRRRGML